MAQFNWLSISNVFSWQRYKIIHNGISYSSKLLKRLTFSRQYADLVSDGWIFSMDTAGLAIEQYLRMGIIDYFCSHGQENIPPCGSQYHRQHHRAAAGHDRHRHSRTAWIGNLYRRNCPGCKYLQHDLLEFRFHPDEFQRICIASLWRTEFHRSHERVDPLADRGAGYRTAHRAAAISHREVRTQFDRFGRREQAACGNLFPDLHLECAGGTGYLCLLRLFHRHAECAHADDHRHHQQSAQYRA